MRSPVESDLLLVAHSATSLVRHRSLARLCRLQVENGENVGEEMKKSRQNAIKVGSWLLCSSTTSTLLLLLLLRRR